MNAAPLPESLALVAIDQIHALRREPGERRGVSGSNSVCGATTFPWVPQPMRGACPGYEGLSARIPRIRAASLIRWS